MADSPSNGSSPAFALVALLAAESYRNCDCVCSRASASWALARVSRVACLRSFGPWRMASADNARHERPTAKASATIR